MFSESQPFTPRAASEYAKRSGATPLQVAIDLCAGSRGTDRTWSVRERDLVEKLEWLDHVQPRIQDLQVRCCIMVKIHLIVNWFDFRLPTFLQLEKLAIRTTTDCSLSHVDLPPRRPNPTALPWHTHVTPNLPPLTALCLHEIRPNLLSASSWMMAIAPHLRSLHLSIFPSTSSVQLGNDSVRGLYNLPNRCSALRYLKIAKFDSSLLLAELIDPAFFR
ncbi:hypothetical protein DACRYDRAFT_108222 [Dacryopinax primogenitus]|uniref:Uncharacterized protein n=1 Tax=Dacryopinax primogenitus (strain DJM 731) TaxID=1858805 RepID=M5FTB8_DACPD|nr:uncharacterized protein DACRYDRAFT_108222 [Dacryopinax primogenitus]EJU00866.1 hypothetical protein DACRYDRAFT_108222 [Dacryopinax primogenitus]